MTITELDKFIRTLIGTIGKRRTLKRLSTFLPLDQSATSATVYTDDGGCCNEYVLCDNTIARFKSNPHTLVGGIYPPQQQEDVPSLTWYLQSIKGYMYRNVSQ